MIPTTGYLGLTGAEVEKLLGEVHLSEADWRSILHPRNRLGQFRHVIAIDGPAASGKSTVAQAVAEKMGGTYIDTGAHFRAAGLASTRGIDPVDALRNGRIRADGSAVTLDGEDVSAAIRTAAVDRAAAALGGRQEVRDAVQHAITSRLGEGGLFVADGRDAGNALQAEDRIYLTARPDVRAKRRATARGLSVEDALAAIQERDALDAPRIEASMQAADHVIDNSDDDGPEHTVERIADAVGSDQPALVTSPVLTSAAVTPEQIAAGLGAFHEGGVRATVRHSRRYPPEGGEVRIDLRTEGDENVGFAAYTWQGDTVHFDRLRVYAGVQDSGIGGAFYAHAEQTFRELGFKHMEVEAIDVGSYAWARHGFRFKRNARSEVDRLMRGALQSGRWNEMREHVPEEVLTEFASRVQDGDFTSPADIASFGREYRWQRGGRTMWPGKYVLVGGRWRGIMAL